MKVATLRCAAEDYRAKASQGVDVPMNSLFASLLSERADRIEAGEDDRSAVFPDVTDLSAGGAVA